MRRFSVKALFFLLALPFAGIAQQEQLDLGMVAKI